MAVIRKPYGPPESDVCERLAAARRYRKFSQEDLADKLGLSRVQLANIETARTILKFDVGWDACKHLNLDQWFLATGDEPVQPFLHVDIESLRSEIGPDYSFRSACGLLQKDFQMARGDLPPRVGHGETLLSAYQQSLASLIHSAVTQSPPSARSELIESMDAVLRHLRKKQNLETKALTDLGNALKSEGMKRESLWESLRKRLTAVVSQFGAKSALAREFKVSPASVSEWLSGESSPTAETTLRLLQWVAEAEAKQTKSPGRAINAAKAEGPNRKSTENEKPKSGPQK